MYKTLFLLFLLTGCASTGLEPVGSSGNFPMPCAALSTNPSRTVCAHPGPGRP